MLFLIGFVSNTPHYFLCNFECERPISCARLQESRSEASGMCNELFGDTQENDVGIVQLKWLALPGNPTLQLYLPLIENLWCLLD